MTDADEAKLVSGHSLGTDMITLITQFRRHIAYIESALNTAEGYASGLLQVEIPLERFDEAMSYLSRAQHGDYDLAAANEAALNLRRAGDVALNNHYG